MSPSKRNSNPIAGAPEVTPSPKNNSRNSSKDSPSVGRALNSLTCEGWSLNHLHRGVPLSDLQAQGTRDSPRPAGCGVELGKAVVWMGTGSQGLPKPRACSGAGSPTTPRICRSVPTQLPSTQGSWPGAVQEHAPRLLPPGAPWDGGTVPAQTGDGGTAAARLFVLCIARKALGGAVCSPSTVGGAGPVPAAPSLFPLPRAPSQPAPLVLGCLRAS